jgi:hypothetical protein
VAIQFSEMAVRYFFVGDADLLDNGRIRGMKRQM